MRGALRHLRGGPYTDDNELIFGVIDGLADPSQGFRAKPRNRFSDQASTLLLA